MNTQEIRRRLNEGKDISVYKKLLEVLSLWSEHFPMTGVDGFLEKAVEYGKSILPKDKQALSILQFILSKESFSAAVSALLNTRFSDLPANLKPFTKTGRRMELAFWCVDGRVSDMVKDLVNFKGFKTQGFFCDTEGNKVELIDLNDE